VKEVAHKKNNMKQLWIKKGLMILLFGTIAIIVFGFVVMGLWNNILVAVTGVKAITFLQALGILLLSKILFGGFGGGGKGWRGSPAWKEKMKQRWDKMTPEERDKFKAEWKNRCGGRWGSFNKKDEDTMMAD
jgi:Ca2+/H+ antiporter, TMEM165/GDT1 family